MLLGNKEKTVKIHVENFLQGNLGIEKGQVDEERRTIHNGVGDFSNEIISWLQDNERIPQPENHKQNTTKMYYKIINYRVRGIITGKIHDEDLESRIEELVREKTKLEDSIKNQKDDNIKAVTIIKEQDRQIALMESQIFFMKQGKSSGT